MGRKHQTSRRDFLKGAALLATGAAVGRFGGARVLAESLAPAPAPVVALARSPLALDQQGRPDQKVLKALVQQAVSTATGLPAEQAFRSLFRPSDRISIKVNTLAGRGASTRPELVQAVVEELLAAGIPGSQIIIWDRRDRELERAGFTVRRSSSDVRCFGTEGDYEAEPREAGSVGSCFSTILTRQSTSMINMPVLKDHDLSGVSLGMKNFYGAIHNPNKYHDSQCDPYIADLFAHPLIGPRVRLTVCDALRPQYDGGPAYRPDHCWPLGGVLASVDPLALDRAGVVLLEGQRRLAGLGTFAEAKRAPAWLETAARLGVGSPQAPQIKEVAL